MLWKLIYVIDGTAALKPINNEALETISLNISCGCQNVEWRAQDVLSCSYIFKKPPLS
jgi:hypothetical protein